MKYSIFLLSILALSGCATTVPMHIVSSPANKTLEQKRADNAECSYESHRTAPFLFGLGPVLSRNSAADGYTECMSNKGYSVERK